MGIRYCNEVSLPLYPNGMGCSSPQIIDMRYRFEGNRVVYTGDRISISMEVHENGRGREGNAFLRTNLFMGDYQYREIIEAYEAGRAESRNCWADYPMQLVEETEEGDGIRRIWIFEAMVPRAGFFWAKPCFNDRFHYHHWPDGDNLKIHVHRSSWRFGNTLYCAWPRLMDEGRTMETRRTEHLENQWAALERGGLWVQPRSGTLRDLGRNLDHIMETLGCRVVHLMPVNPVPMTDTRLGRMGSPYAATSLVDIDPSVVEFDRRTTGLEQFEELTTEIHRRGGRVIIDLVINHTGWGSQLFENHPDFFERTAEGEFVSPGAWGNTWADLVALNHQSREQTCLLAEAFLTWCRRGVDGFRCDAGYQVPLPIWRYITARVLSEFPDTIFFLEGLGGAVEATRALLEEGGMQWAYSELFQNESDRQIAEYPEFSHSMSLHTGCFVHYCETHDNNRMAARGRDWAVFRVRLCAALSANGAFGITTGVEWLATEKINVHNRTGLRWGNPQNIVPLISRINRTLLTHPLFAEGVRLERLTPSSARVQVWRRFLPKAVTAVQGWVLINNDLEHEHRAHISQFSFRDYANLKDLFGSETPNPVSTGPGSVFEIIMPPGSVYVLSEVPCETEDEARSRIENGRLLGHLVECIDAANGDVPHSPQDASSLVETFLDDHEAFLDSLDQLSDEDWGGDWLKAIQSRMASPCYRRVCHWEALDCRREFVLPAEHWLVFRNPDPFRILVTTGVQRDTHSDRGNWAESVYDPQSGQWIHCMSPARFRDQGTTHFTVRMIPHGTAFRNGLKGVIRLADPVFDGVPQISGPVFPTVAPESPCVLLTNRRGAMAMLRLDFGEVDSKYDCVLGANLHDTLPVDRHVMVKRLRLWARFGHRTVPLNRERLISFSINGGARWVFLLSNGREPLAEIEVAMVMEQGANTVRFQSRVLRLHQNPDPAGLLILTIRVDIEDRNFHTQTHLNEHGEGFFRSAVHELSGEDRSCQGFVFEPAADRRLGVWSTHCDYNPEPELCHGITHPVEASRGQEGYGDAYSPGWFSGNLLTHPFIELTLSTESEFDTKRVPAQLPHASGQAHSLDAVLERALRDFVVRREDGWTVIAGYPWFLDWGRDTLIAARGMVAAGMQDELMGILRVFGRYEESGTLPNTIHGGDLSNRHTSDAPLWFGIVCEDLEQSGFSSIYDTRVEKAGRTLKEVLISIARGYRDGTPAGMRMDQASGLIWSPSHYTWMDTNFPAGTPREGYPIEIQVLWYRLLRLLVRLDEMSSAQWDEISITVRQSIDGYFWREDLGYYSDLLACGADTPAASAIQDSALRSNQILAVSLGFAFGEKARRSVVNTARYLVIPGGLRSLAPLPVEKPHPVHSNQGYLLNDPQKPYWPVYAGDEDTRRKPAYHNGTAWSWTFPGFCEALAMAYDCSPEAVSAAKSYLLTARKTLWDGCFGQIPEVMDGDYPHTQRGCPAQAWGVSETLRVWKFLNRPVSSNGNGNGAGR